MRGGVILMEKKELFKLLNKYKTSNKALIEMILSSHLDYHNGKNASISNKQWGKIAECIIEYFKIKENR